MRVLLLAAFLAATSGAANAASFEKPDRFDQQVWNYLTLDQKISVIAKLDTRPDPLATDSDAAATAMVKALLKDPDTAKFHGVKRRAALDYCGWVNAKNGFGGYVGDAVFFANDKFTVLLDPAASDPKFC